MIDISKIPENPGVYLFLDKNKKVIYIGKAKNLKKRVASYFNRDPESEKTKILIEKIKDVDIIITNNEVEAFILENNLIKKNKPMYNIDLRDSKSYAYIELTKEEFPRFVISRKKEKGKYFGPFVNAQSRDYIIQLLSKTFKLRTCKRLPKRACIRYHIKACSAPCIKKISKKNYLQSVNKASSVLKGETRKLLIKLKNDMKKYSRKQDFEKAIEIREQIYAITYLDEKQTVERNKKYDEDIINFIKRDEKVYLIVFNIDKGILLNKQEFVFDYYSDFLEDFLSQYYDENKIPKKLILPKKVDKSVIDYLSLRKKSKVKQIIPKKGELNNLIELVKKNIEISFFGDESKLIELQNKLNMQELPRVIEGFDVSHLKGEEVVASLVQFRNGKPYKSNYRKFKIKSFEGVDDVAGIKEVVKRRYYRILKENKEMPNLVLIDGGINQLNAAMKALGELGVKIPVISLAKREEEIYLPGGKILKLDKKNKGLLLLIRIRDEAHRFAISFQKLRRKKRFFGKE